MTIDYTFIHDEAVKLFEWAKNFVPEHAHDQLMYYIQDHMQVVAHNERAKGDSQ